LGDPSFTTHAAQITALAMRHALPAISTLQEFALGGGLMSWGTSLTEQHRLAGTAKVVLGRGLINAQISNPRKWP
jgi:hypothetical protein